MPRQSRPGRQIPTAPAGDDHRLELRRYCPCPEPRAKPQGRGRCGNRGAFGRNGADEGADARRNIDPVAVRRDSADAGGGDGTTSEGGSSARADGRCNGRPSGNQRSGCGGAGSEFEGIGSRCGRRHVRDGLIHPRPVGTGITVSRSVSSQSADSSGNLGQIVVELVIAAGEPMQLRAGYRALI